jgi:hypothetical protein
MSALLVLVNMLTDWQVVPDLFDALFHPTARELWMDAFEDTFTRPACRAGAPPVSLKKVRYFTFSVDLKLLLRKSHIK